MPKLNKYQKAALAVVKKHRRFPENTCPASRHAQMIGEHLTRKKPYAMLGEEPDHCGESILWAIAALYEVRAQLAEVDAMLSVHASKLDSNPPDKWPKGSILKAALDRHERRLHPEREAEKLAAKVGFSSSLDSEQRK